MNDGKVGFSKKVQALFYSSFFHFLIDWHLIFSRRPLTLIYYICACWDKENIIWRQSEVLQLVICWLRLIIHSHVRRGDDDDGTAAMVFTLVIRSFV